MHLRWLNLNRIPDSAQSVTIRLSRSCISNVSIQWTTVILDLRTIGGLLHSQLPAKALTRDNCHVMVQERRPGGGAISSARRGRSRIGRTIIQRHPCPGGKNVHSRAIYGDHFGSDIHGAATSSGWCCHLTVPIIYRSIRCVLGVITSILATLFIIHSRGWCCLNGTLLTASCFNL